MFHHSLNDYNFQSHDTSQTISCMVEKFSQVGQSDTVREKARQNSNNTSRSTSNSKRKTQNTNPTVDTVLGHIVYAYLYVAYIHVCVNINEKNSFSASLSLGNVIITVPIKINCDKKCCLTTLRFKIWYWHLTLLCDMKWEMEYHHPWDYCAWCFRWIIYTLWWTTFALHETTVNVSWLLSRMTTTSDLACLSPLADTLTEYAWFILDFYRQSENVVWCDRWVSLVCRRFTLHCPVFCYLHTNSAVHEGFVVIFLSSP